MTNPQPNFDFFPKFFGVFQQKLKFGMSATALKGTIQIWMWDAVNGGQQPQP